MAFLDRLKTGKKSDDKVKEAKKPAAKAKKAEAKVVVETKTETKAAPVAKSNAHRVLLRPLVSEKTARLEKNRQFVFAVATDANKIEIKKAVEKHYRVHVTGVNVVNVLGKNTGGRTPGKRNDWRKAYVTVKAGESITY